MSGTARRLAEAANHIINPQPIAEAFKNGDKVKVPHKGKMVSGKVVRYDDGGTDKARQSGGGYVVDVGEPASILVPKEKVQKEAVVTEAESPTGGKKPSNPFNPTLGDLLKSKQQDKKADAKTKGVKEEAEQIDELTKMRRLGQTVGAILSKNPGASTPAQRLKTAQSIRANKQYWTPERIAKEDEIDAKIRKVNAADAVEEIKEIINSYDKQTKAMIIAGMKSIKESAEITEAPYTPANDYEGEMAMTQLKSIMEKASDVLGMMKPEAKMEAWVQSKITLADEHISCVRDYLKHTDGAVG